MPLAPQIVLFLKEHLRNNRLASNLKSFCFCFPSAGIKSVQHLALLFFVLERSFRFLNTSLYCCNTEWVLFFVLEFPYTTWLLSCNLILIVIIYISRNKGWGDYA
jgi:hypothetical protein